MLPVGVMWKYFLWIIIHYIVTTEAYPVILATKRCSKDMSCVGLMSCKPYTSHVKDRSKPLSLFFVRFLRSNHCGFSYGYPKVCCGEIPKSIIDGDILKHKPYEIIKKQLSEIDNEFWETIETKFPTARPEKERKVYENVFPETPNFYMTDIFGTSNIVRRNKRHPTSKNKLDIEIR
ncbi:hypothetical protein WA026_005100 [Henosepilachna vigintioctopunctata]|uniref:Clip domain-containing protein n=1 Tax=Henosepilachna vigintioctopunctata TaxID=420089 RepID=A0AAW1UM43_9CUCU